MSKPRIIIGQYRRETRLPSTDAISKLYRCTHVSTGEMFLMKTISRKKIGAEQEAGLTREIEFMSRFQHPNLLKLEYLMQSDTHYYLILQHAEEGQLIEHLLKDGPALEPIARGYFQQLVAVVSFLHGHKSYHRDLKPEDLMRSRGRLLLSGFGLGVVQSWGSMKRMTRLTGNPCSSPEYLTSEEGYKPGPHDVWGAGVILYLMLTARHPFRSDNLLVLAEQASHPEKYLSFPASMSSSAQDLLRRIFVIDPGQRLSIDDVSKHPWVAPGFHHVPGDFLGSSMVLDHQVERPEVDAFELVSRLIGGIGQESAHRLLSTSKSPEDAFAACLEIVKMVGGKTEKLGETLVRGSAGAALQFQLECKPLKGTDQTLVEISLLSGSEVELDRLTDGIRRVALRV